MDIVKPSWSRIIKDNFFYNYTYNYAGNQIEVFRIALSAYSLVSVGTLLIDFPLFFSDKGLINWEVSSASSYWFEMHPYKLSSLLGIRPEVTMGLLLLVYILSLTLQVVGVYTRLTAIVSLVSFVCLTNVTAAYGYGVDVYQTVCLFLLCIFPTGYGLSIRKKQPYADIDTLKMVSIRVLQVYLCLTYMSAGFEKAMMKSWWDGSFIFYLVNDPTVMASGFIPKDLHFGFYSILGIVVVLIESLYFVFVWIPMARTIGIFLIVGMHLFIAIGMDLFFFGMLLILLNLVCWYPALLSDLRKLKKP